MRVLVVTTWLPTPAAPESGIFVERDIELLARDHEVDVLHLSAASTSTAAPRAGDPGWERSGASWRRRTLAMRPADPRSVGRAGAAVRELLPRYDLVHTMAASSLVPMRGLRPAPPWVHTEHWSALLAPSTAPLVARAAIPSIRRALRRPDVVVAVGDRLAAEIGRVRAGEIAVVPNAVVAPEHLVERPAGPVLRLIGVGGLVPRKGPDLAVGALAELVARGTDASLEWIGDGPMRSEVEAAAARAGIADRVVLRGRLHPAQVGEALTASDLFVLPTESETFGVAIAEALAHGRPVVVGAEGGHAEFVREPDGVLVAPRTASAYADAIERVVERNRERSAADIAASVTARFSDDARRAGYADVYATATEVARARR